jgi:16S rRNA (guanine(966)-N(2))-methyltransferase RsmD
MRIVAGTSRGRRLKVPDGRLVRPTADRVREALFSSLGQRVVNTRVLDLFAGSGALGLEAISRGARECVFVDAARQSIEILRENIVATGFEDQSRVIRGDGIKTLSLLARNTEIFDLVFLDPPYAGDLLDRALVDLNRLNLLGEHAIVVAEHDKNREILVPPNLHSAPTRIYGGSALTVLQKCTT